MATDVFLHIGAPKTGTSFLQLTLWNNSDQVEEAGVTMLLGSRARQFDAVADFRGGMWAQHDLKATWQDLVESAAAAPGRALLTEELLCGTPADQIGALVESLHPARVHVVLTARDIGRQVPAEWQQAVRARSPHEYGEWLDMLRSDPDRPFWQAQDPARVLARWAPHVPAERLHLVTVPPAGVAPQELWRRFGSVIGLPGTVREPEQGKRNPSLGVHEAELLRRVNAGLGDRLPMRQAYTAVIRDHLMRPVLLPRDPELKLGVPDDQAAWIVSRSREIATSVSALGVDVVGRVEDLVTERVPEGGTPEDLSSEELLDTSVEVLVQLLLHIEEDMLPAMRRLRQRAVRAERARRENAVTAEKAPDLLGAVRRRLRKQAGGR